MTIRYDDIDDLLPSEYQEPWPPLSDEEIEERAVSYTHLTLPTNREV